MQQLRTLTLASLPGGQAVASNVLRHAGRDLLAGSVVAFVTLTFTVGHGVMIFSGSLDRYLPLGMPALLVSCCLVGFVIALRSSLPLSIGAPDSNVIAIFAVAAARIADDIRTAGGSDAVVIFTVLAVLAMTALVTAVVAYAFGRSHRGALIHSVPHKFKCDSRVRCVVPRCTMVSRRLAANLAANLKSSSLERLRGQAGQDVVRLIATCA